MSEQRKYLTMGDWLAAKAAGLDAGRRPVSEQFYRPTPGELPPPVPTHYPVTFSLFGERERPRDRRRKVDQLLAEVGVRPRRR